MIIGVEGLKGERLEIGIDEEADGTTSIEIRDWEEGGVIAEVTYGASLQEFKDEVARG